MPKKIGRDGRILNLRPLDPPASQTRLTGLHVNRGLQRGRPTRPVSGENSNPAESARLEADPSAYLYPTSLDRDNPMT